MPDAPYVQSAPPRHGIGIAPYAALIGGNGADLATTLRALTSGAGHEANPLMSTSPVGITAQKAAGTAGLALLMHELAQRGHPKIAKAIGYLDGGAMAGLALHNAHVGPR